MPRKVPFLRKEFKLCVNLTADRLFIYYVVFALILGPFSLNFYSRDTLTCRLDCTIGYIPSPRLQEEAFLRYAISCNLCLPASVYISVVCPPPKKSSSAPLGTKHAQSPTYVCMRTGACTIYAVYENFAISPYQMPKMHRVLQSSTVVLYYTYIPKL